jgi:quercetin dioxygenase-like cupin family protein
VGQRVFGLSDFYRGGTLARSSLRTALSRSIACFVLAASLVLAEPYGLPALAVENGATVTPVASNALPNLPGQHLTAVLVSYAPGGRSPAHHHAGSVIAYVIEGAIRSQLGGGDVRVYRAGESFFEPPGAVHLVSENASATEPASLLAIFVAPESAALTVDEN